MALKQKNIGKYDKCMKELDSILEQKIISYAQFTKHVGWQTVAFYNRYKVYGFDIEEMERFVAVAKLLKTNMITCIRCGSKVVPKAKSVRRVLCEGCKQEIAEMKENDSLKYKYPDWVNGIKNDSLRDLVEQEFHIDEKTAYQMSLCQTTDKAKEVRALRWEVPSLNISSSLSGISVLVSKVH